MSPARNANRGTSRRPTSRATGRDHQPKAAKLGRVGVDSASIGITDLLWSTSDETMRNVGAPDSRYAVPGSKFAGDWGSGIRFWSGLGDGGYEVWGWIVDYGKDGALDERVAQITVTMIDDHDLAEWHGGHCPNCSAPCAECKGEGCDECHWQGHIHNGQPCR